MVAEQISAKEIEEFGKFVALFDSDKLGECENAFRKAVLLCKRNGIRFADLAGMAFGASDSGEVAALREELRRQQAQHAADVQEASATVARLRRELAEARSGNEERDRDNEWHEIDLKGRFRRAWETPQFRLFTFAAFMVMMSWVSDLHNRYARILPILIGLVGLWLVAAWSVALFNRRGFGQLLLKWLLWYAVFGPAWLILGERDMTNTETFSCVLAVAVIVNCSRLSDWMARMIRRHFWESELVKAVRRWF